MVLPVKRSGRPKWTPPEALLDRIGIESDEEIARSAGVSVFTVAKYRRQVRGIKLPRGRFRSVSYLRIRRLRAEGLSHREIAAVVGCSHGTVGRVLRATR